MCVSDVFFFDNDMFNFKFDINGNMVFYFIFFIFVMLNKIFIVEFDNKSYIGNF